MSKFISHDDLENLAIDIKDCLSELPTLNHSWLKYKDSNDAVTDLDIYLQSTIMSLIGILDPGVLCISEESNMDSIEEQVCWIIDPLDGTSNLIQGLRPSAISLAKVSGKEVLAALVIDLSNLDVYSAVKAGGARFNSNKIEVVNAGIRLIGMSTGYLRRGGVIPQEWNARILGSQALQLCLVALGTLSSTISFEAKAWDDVAGSLIVEESGGTYQHAYSNQSWLELAVSQKSLRSRAIVKSLGGANRIMILELVNE